ncbi:MAG: PD40 domain-containing protein, partial [Chloroflexia bacterium]|nr:PD40 domain-containing protein [Chloroflexia bacterium]
MKTHTGARSRYISSLLLLALLATALLGMAEPAGASMPGDNGKIAYVTTRNGAYEIYAMNTDGTGQTRLTNSTEYEENPAWSPDGSKIAYDGNGIRVMNADGTGQTSMAWGNRGDSTWSPDGTKIAYGRDSQIWVRNANGGEETNLTNNFIVADVVSPAWSPDGSKIAYATNRDGDFEIYVINTDGSGVTRLTSNGIADGRPDWSPDGSKIVFTSYAYGDYDPPEIYVMNADGSGQTNLSRNSSYDHYPAWSPDGSRIAFASYRGGPLDIYTMNPDGSGVTRITRDGSNNFQPAW